MNTEPQVPVTVLLLDNRPIFRSGFATSMKAHGIKVLGEVENAADVVERFNVIKPDVLVMDLRFGEALSSMDMVAELLKQSPNANIVCLSQFVQLSLIKHFYQIGGKAFVSIDCLLRDLAEAVKKAKAGQTYFQPIVAERLANLSVLGDQTPEAVLDERELLTFKMMAEGLTSVEIADALGLSIKTISNTSQAIKDTLGVQRPAEITRLAIRYGLIEA